MSAAGSIDFFDRALNDFAAGLDDPRLRSGLEQAGLEARASMVAFHEWLEGSLMPASAGDFAIGRPLYERLLAEEHGLPWTADELIAVGPAVYQDTMREIKRVAAHIQPGKPWSKVVESVKQVHPSVGEVLGSYAPRCACARFRSIRRPGDDSRGRLLRGGPHAGVRAADLPVCGLPRSGAVRQAATGNVLGDDGRCRACPKSDGRCFCGGMRVSVFP